MVQNQSFEDGRRSQILEEKIEILCDTIDQLGMVFGVKVDEVPYDLGVQLQAVYTEYESLMARYGEKVSQEVKVRYEEAQSIIH